MDILNGPEKSCPHCKADYVYQQHPMKPIGVSSHVTCECPPPISFSQPDGTTITVVQPNRAWFTEVRTTEVPGGGQLTEYTLRPDIKEMLRVDSEKLKNVI